MIIFGFLARWLLLEIHLSRVPTQEGAAAHAIQGLFQRSITPQVVNNHYHYYSKEQR